MTNEQLVIYQNDLAKCKTNNTLFFIVCLATIFLAVFTAGAGLILTFFTIVIWVIVALVNDFEERKIKKKLLGED